MSFSRFFGSESARNFSASPAGGRMPHVSRYARRTNSASVQGPDGGMRSNSSFLRTNSSMKLFRGDFANVVGSSAFGERRGNRERRDLRPEVDDDRGFAVAADRDEAVLVHARDEFFARCEPSQSRDVFGLAVGIDRANDDAQTVLGLEERGLGEDLNALESRVGVRRTGHAGL